MFFFLGLESRDTNFVHKIQIFWRYLRSNIDFLQHFIFDILTVSHLQILQIMIYLDVESDVEDNYIKVECSTDEQNYNKLQVTSNIYIELIRIYMLTDEWVKLRNKFVLNNKCFKLNSSLPYRKLEIETSS